MLTTYKMVKRLSSSFSLILDGSVGLSAGIQYAGDSVPETLDRNLYSAEEDNLSHFNSKITCLWQSMDINNKWARVVWWLGARALTGS